MADPDFVSLDIVTADGVRLLGREYPPRGTATFTALLLPGIGVPQRAMRHLGGFLAERGVRAFSIDYRGMGESTAGAASATLRVWAERDAVAALELAEERWKNPVVLFGHSFGGQVLGLGDAFSRLAGSVLIASQFGQAKYWDGFERVKVAAFWHVILPVASALFETVPGWFGAGEALPRGIGKEWGLWGRSRDWYVTHVPGAAERLARFDRPILAYAASDDPIAPPRAVTALLSRFESAKIERRDIRPGDLGVQKIGHFGLMRPIAASLWADMLAFAERAAAQTPYAPT
jgi:predicted alpha/beta hydrolase